MGLQHLFRSASPPHSSIQAPPPLLPGLSEFMTHDNKLILRGGEEEEEVGGGFSQSH